MDQLVKRIDQKGRSLSQFFKEEIADPFGKIKILFIIYYYQGGAK